MLEVDAHENRAQPPQQVNVLYQVLFSCTFALRHRPLILEIEVACHADDTERGGAEEERAEIGNAHNSDSDV